MRHYLARFRRPFYALRLAALVARACFFPVASDDSAATAKGDPERSERLAPSWTDEDLTLATVTAIGDRATRVLEPESAPGGLPHPLITDANLDHHLGQATRAHLAVRATNARHGVDLLLPATDAQAGLDAALIDCLHQIDHRTKQQDQRIIELESKLTEADRRIRSLEAELT